MNCASARKDETFALQSADCSHLKKKKFKKKQKRIWRARAFARFSSSLVFFSVSFATTPRAKAQRRRGRESFKKKVFVVVKFAPDLEDKKEEERESFGSKSTISLSLSLSLFTSSLLLLLPFLLSGVVVVVSIIPRFFRDVEDKTLTNLLLLLLLLLFAKTVSFRKKKSTRTRTLTVATISSKAVSDDARTFCSCWRLSRFGSVCWRAAGTVFPTAIRLC